MVDEIEPDIVIRKRGGRLPLLSRSDVELIKNDTRPAREVAAEYGVAADTVNRVRQVGRFKDMPYVPREETDRTMEEPQAIVYNGRAGRPFVTGRAGLSQEEREKIGRDTRSRVEVAREWGVSLAYIDKLRRIHGSHLVKRSPLSVETRAAIKASDLDDNYLASSYRVPAKVIRAIKDGTI